MVDSKVIFRGIAQIQLNDNGQLNIPKKYCDKLNDEKAFTITFDTSEGCILLFPNLFPKEEFERITKPSDSVETMRLINGFDRSVVTTRSKSSVGLRASAPTYGKSEI